MWFTFHSITKSSILLKFSMRYTPQLNRGQLNQLNSCCMAISRGHCDQLKALTGWYQSQYFLLHTRSVTVSTDEEAACTTEKVHILAKINCFQDHPQKYLLGNRIILPATVCETSYSVSQFMPVSHFISRCAVVKRRLQTDYGEDLVYVAIPVRKHNIFSHQWCILAIVVLLYLLCYTTDSLKHWCYNTVVLEVGSSC